MGGKMKIYRDQNKTCINIGDWDYQFDNQQVPRNPLPDGAVESDEETIVGWDGGRYAHDDPRAVKS
jgi:hypothetical protein